MLLKGAKRPPLGRQIFGVLIILESAGFGVSYYFWHKLNKSRDYRLAIKEKHPWILEKYYALGETIDKDNAIRKIDQQIWSALEKTDSKANS